MDIDLEDAGSTLEAIEFLARSTNRISVLQALTGGGMERRDLEEATGVSRPTLSRILDDFETRGWVEATGRHYALTPLGAYVTAEFTDFVDRMRVDGTLADVVEYLPDAGFDFDLACLASAEVVRPAKTDALAPTTHIVRRLEAADRVQVLTYTVLADAFEACHRATLEGDLEVEVVFDAETLATLAADPRSVEQARRMLETGRVGIYQAARPVPFVLIIPDDEVVVICLSGPDGTPRAVIDTADDTVRDWAASTFAGFRDDAVRLDPALFAG